MNNKVEKLLVFAIFFSLVLALLAQFSPKFSRRQSVVAQAQLIPEVSLPQMPETKDETETAPVENEKLQTPTEAAKPLPPIGDEEIQRIRQLAKSTLSGVYTASKAYYAEYGRYTSDLNSMGWSISIEGTEVPFKFGFLSAFQPEEANHVLSIDENPNRFDTDFLLEKPMPEAETNGSSKNYEYAKNVESLHLADFQNLCQFGCKVNPEEFEAMLVIPLGDENHVDVWTINQNKELKLVQDGLK